MLAGVPPEEQVLLFGGTPLDDDTVLGQSPLPELATLELSTRLLGGMSCGGGGATNDGGLIILTSQPRPLTHLLLSPPPPPTNREGPRIPRPRRQSEGPDP